MPLYEPYVGVVKLATRRHPNPDKIIAAYATCSYDGDIASMQRCTARGHVLAAWSSGRFLLQDEEGYVMRVELDDPSSRPACGEFLTVLGYPETDLYRINLTRAKYRPEAGGSAPVQTALDVSPEELLLDSSGQRMVKPNYLGRLIRMRGRVKAVPSGLGDRKSILIESGKFLVPVDVSAKPEIAKSMKEEPELPEFTKRQQDILHSVTRGLTNEEIAMQFGISVSGVKHHCLTIFKKLGAANRSEAVAIAMRRQLLKT